MFKPVSAKLNVNEMEEGVLKFWKDADIFKKSTENREGGKEYVFFEGPPTANGKPGVHHVLSRSFKDVILRYRTMQGCHISRRGGWDTHGLPVELQVEKELKISGKPDIEKYGIEEFNQKCKESVWVYQSEWEKLTKRIAFWLDMEKPYITYTNEYIESLWWILKEMDKKGLVYSGYKIVPQCPRCGTALSSHEVAQGYKNVEENSVYLKFKVRNEKDTYILSWTTTPWSLPGNIALAVGEDIEYVKVKKNKEVYILAKALAPEVLDNEYEVVEEMTGKDLVGLEYEPLFPGSLDPGDKKAWYVGKANFVSTADGTGVVHTAVMYGEDDFNFGLEYDLPFVHTVDESGKFLPSVEKWAGKFVKNKTVEEEIIADLDSRGLLLKTKIYAHDYPFCWRCDSPLLYYAKDSWFIKMSSLKDKLIANNESINWVPEHIKEGRFGEWLVNIRDWAISRQRYWGTPIPIWVCDKCGEKDVVGSFEELEKLAGTLPKNKKGEVDPHRPFIDALTFKCSCGGTKQRVKDVFDAWFDSGSMPFAQHHYPFENKELIDKGVQFPAEFISEAIDQTRGWFYTLLAVSTCLGKEAPYKNVICLGHIRDKFGKKMSKSKGNVIDPWMITDKYGVDALRFYLYTMNQPGEYKNFDEAGLQDVLRKVIMLLGNVVSFLELYNDKNAKIEIRKSKNTLDKWILAKFNLLVKEVTDDLNNYHIYEAGRRLIEFIDELSTWYVRRSRDRFKDEGEDKEDAKATLNFVLHNLIRVMAPFTPFVTERLYQRLGGQLDSVHLESWPEFDEKAIDQELLTKMAKARQLVELGLAARDEKQIKVRQPLATLEYSGVKLGEEFEKIVADELNIKEVKNVSELSSFKFVVKENYGFKIGLDVEISEELKLEGVLRELTRGINGLRRNQGFTINDRVKLVYNTSGEEVKKLFANSELVEKLKQATLLSGIEAGAGENKIKVNEEEAEITLLK